MKDQGWSTIRTLAVLLVIGLTLAGCQNGKKLGCGFFASYKLGGSEHMLGSCSGLVVPAAKLTLRVGQKIDVGVSPHIYWPIRNSAPNVLRESHVDKRKWLVTYTAIARGSAELSGVGQCYYEATRKQILNQPCPLLDITVTR